MTSTGHLGLAQHELGRRDARDLFQRAGGFGGRARHAAPDAVDLRTADRQALRKVAVSQTCRLHPVAKGSGVFCHDR